MTPAIKLLDRNKIEHSVHAYEHNSNTESYGLEAVEALGVDAARVFKTLICELADGEYVVAVVPVSGQLDLKALAKSLSAKKATMADKAKAQTITGYVLGGVSPLGQKKRLRTVIDASAFEHTTVFVSAGKRGLDVELCPNDLTSLCRAQSASISTH